MITRSGKIARLPKQVRHDLNSRLEDGAPGNQLVEWLNGLPAVQEVLQLRFGRRPVSEQNLSEWKQGGYQGWLKLQPNQTQSNPIKPNQTESSPTAHPGSLSADSPNRERGIRYKTLKELPATRLTEFLRFARPPHQCGDWQRHGGCRYQQLHL